MLLPPASGVRCRTVLLRRRRGAGCGRTAGVACQDGAMTAPQRAARARRPAASDEPDHLPAPAARPADAEQAGAAPPAAGSKKPGKGPDGGRQNAPQEQPADPAGQAGAAPFAGTPLRAVGSPAADAEPAARSSSRRRYGGVAPEVRQRQRRERLVEAGLHVFGTRGFHGATVREVCARAQLTERYFYESFAGLPALFEAVYTSITDELRMNTLAALAVQPPDADAMAEAALRVFYETIRSDACRARICLIEAVSVGPLGGELGDESARQYAALVRHFLSLLYVEEGFDELDLDLLASGLIGMNIHIATEWVRSGFVTPMERVIATNMAAYRALGAAFASRRRPPAG